MRKLTASEALAMRKAAIGTACPISGKIILELHDACLDHDHRTGEVRGVLSRWGNAQLGKAENSANRAKGEQSVVQTLFAMWQWVHTARTGYIYPTHKDAAQKKAATAARRKKLAAQKAAAKMQGIE